MNYGEQIKKTTTYRLANEKVNLYNYDCIITDFTLPDGEGFDIVQVLKKISATTGVIIISA